jgi:hypothetical protein
MAWDFISPGDRDDPFAYNSSCWTESMADVPDFHEVQRLLAEHERGISERVREYSSALKEAEQEGWTPEAVARASAIAEEAKQMKLNGEAIVDEAIERLRSAGFTLPETQGGSYESSRWWAKDLGRDKIEPTAFLEDHLKNGIDRLISNLPREWWRQQIEIREQAGDRYLREPLVLYGGIRIFQHLPPVHRYAYGLLLAMDWLSASEKYDVYSGAFLIPAIGTLCGLLEPLSAVKGGLQKLDELPKCPSAEVDSRLYELATVARCAAMGRKVEILFSQSDVSPDFRLHDLRFPAVGECKMQRRLSASEELETALLQRVFSMMVEDHKRHIVAGDLQIRFVVDPETLEASQIFEAARDLYTRINPFGEVDVGWGRIALSSLPLSIELPMMTPIYGPEFLKRTFNFQSEEGHFDGICAKVENDGAVRLGRAALPFCLKWRTDNSTAIERKARHITMLMLEAIDQIPVGEAGFIYIAYEDSHRGDIADLRTRRIMETVENFFFKRRGVIPLHVIVNRLFPKALGDGRPDLIESAIIIAEKDIWRDDVPIRVFVPSGSPGE